MKNQKPNIVFILNDHQAYYRHGWDKGPKVKRPNFDRLASQGISFERAYSVCPLCGPARRSMLNGLYPHNHGEIHNGTDIPFERDTYLDVLKDNGYNNYYYGKWHAGPGTAYDHGCAGFSYESYNNPYTKPEYKQYLKKYNLPEPLIFIENLFKPTTDQIGEGRLYKQDKKWCNEHASGIMVTQKETHEAFFLANLACQKLEEIASSKSEEPFSLRVDFWGPHQPYFPTQEYIDLYNPKEIPVYGSFRDNLENRPDIYKHEKNYGISRDGRIIIPNPMPWEKWQKVLSRCYAQSTLIDDAGGEIIDTLDRLGLKDNTIIIWTTDHGDAIASHGGHFDKRSYMPEEMIRIPMVIRYPKKIKESKVCKSLVSNMDIAPTILDAAGLSFPYDTDGKSILPICTGNTNEQRDYIVCETHGHGEKHIGRAVVSSKFKYIFNKDDMDELYNLENDVFELINLIDNSDYTFILDEMKKKYRKWKTSTNDYNY